MNERIIDLYEQASDIERDVETSKKSYSDRVTLRFAELLVAEILKLATENMGYSEYIHVKNRVKEHFGVE